MAEGLTRAQRQIAGMQTLDILRLLRTLIDLVERPAIGRVEHQARKKTYQEMRDLVGELRQREANRTLF